MLHYLLFSFGLWWYVTAGKTLTILSFDWQHRDSSAQPGLGHATCPINGLVILDCHARIKQRDICGNDEGAGQKRRISSSSI